MNKKQIKKAIAILLTLLLALTGSSFAALSEEAVNDEATVAATQEPTPPPDDESGEAAVPSPDTEAVDVPVTEPDAPSDAPSAPPADGEESETEDAPADESAEQEAEPDAGTAEPSDPLPEEEGAPADPPADAPAETPPSDPEDEDLEDIHFTVDGDLKCFDIDEIKRIILASKGCKHAHLYIYDNIDPDYSCNSISSEEHEFTYRVISRDLTCVDCKEILMSVEANIVKSERRHHVWIQEGKEGYSNRLYCSHCDARRTVDYPFSHKRLYVIESGNVQCPVCGKITVLFPTQHNCKHKNITVDDKKNGERSTYYTEFDSTWHLKEVNVYYFDDSDGIYRNAICDDCGILLDVKKEGKKWKIVGVGATDFNGWSEEVSSTIEPHHFAAGICVECGAKQEGPTEGPTNVTITNPLETLGVGESYTLTAKLDDHELASYNSWKSSNTKVLKVNSTGKMTGVKAGTATVTVTTLNNRSAHLTVKVQAAPSKLTLRPRKGTLGVGQKVTLTATLPKNTASQITWTSSDAKVATVEDGLVTANASGEATITAETYNGKRASCVITVKP